MKLFQVYIDTLDNGDYLLKSYTEVKKKDIKSDIVRSLEYRGYHLTTEKNRRGIKSNKNTVYIDMDFIPNKTRYGSVMDMMDNYDFLKIKQIIQEKFRDKLLDSLIR